MKASYGPCAKAKRGIAIFGRYTSIVFSLCALILILLTALPAQAKTTAWTGANSVNWNDAGNWTNDIPVSGDHIVFDANSTANLTNNNDLNLTGLTFEVVSPTGAVDIQGNAFGLAAGGVDMSAATEDLTIDVGVSIPNTATFDVGAGMALFVDGVVSGAGGIVKQGAGDMIAGGAVDNTYTGTTTINAGMLGIGGNYTSSTYLVNGGILACGNADVFPAGAWIFVDASGSFQLTETDQTIGTLTGTGDVVLGTKTLTLGTSADFTFSGNLGSGGDAGNVVKQGSGKFTIAAGTGVIFTTGATTVNAGALQIDGVATTSGVTVANGATLKGNGIITPFGITANAGSTIAPGGSAGQFTADGLTMAGGSKLLLELNGTTAGTEHDQLIIDTAVNLGNATLSIIQSGISVGDAFIIIDNISGGAVNGTFSGLAEGSSFIGGKYAFEITYQGGGGDDVVLTAQYAAPDPTANPATGVSSSCFTANWNPVANASGYRLDVASDWAFTDFNWGGFSNKNVGDVTSYEVCGLRGDWTYLYRVRAIYSAGPSANSNTISVRTSAKQPTSPPDPPDITGGSSSCPGTNSGYSCVNWGSGASSKSWSTSAADYYKVYRAESPLGEKTLLGETHITNYNDLTAEAGRRYYYWITAVNAAGESDFGQYLTGWRYDKNPGRCGLYSGTGRADLMWWGCATDRVCIWYLDGVDKSGQSPTGTTDPANSYLLKAHADFDGDGISDLLWFNPEDGNLQIWLLRETSPESSGSGLAWLIKQTYTLPGVSHSQYLIKAGDFNGDKKADVLWRDLTTGDVSIWLLDGETVLAKAAPAWGEGVQCADEGAEDFSPASTDLPQPQGTLDWEIAGLADFTADGRSEIFWRNPTDGRLTTWIMEDAVIAGCGVISTLNWQGWEVKGLPDLNGDERADILWRNRTSGGLRTWLMDGSSVMERLALGAVEPALSWQIKDFGDFNGDGKIDIYWRDHNAGTVRIWLMDGAAVTQSGAPGTAQDFQ